jgi:hypothetical protein
MLTRSFARNNLYRIQTGELATCIPRFDKALNEHHGEITMRTLPSLTSNERGTGNGSTVW